METITEHQFHVLSEERPGLSGILQGFAMYLGAGAYFAMHTQYTAERVSVVLRALGKVPVGTDVQELWAQLRKEVGLPAMTPEGQPVEEEKVK